MGIMGLYIAAIRLNRWVGKIHCKYKARGGQLETLDINEESHSPLALVLKPSDGKIFLTMAKKRKGRVVWLLTHLCAISDIHQLGSVE